MDRPTLETMSTSDRRIFSVVVLCSDLHCTTALDEGMIGKLNGSLRQRPARMPDFECSLRDFRFFDLELAKTWFTLSSIGAYSDSADLH